MSTGRHARAGCGLSSLLWALSGPRPWRSSTSPAQGAQLGAQLKSDAVVSRPETGLVVCMNVGVAFPVRRARRTCGNCRILCTPRAPSAAVQRAFAASLLIWAVCASYLGGKGVAEPALVVVALASAATLLL